MKLIFTTLLILALGFCKAQPYLDAVYIKAHYSPGVGLFNQNKTGNKIKYLNIGLNFPLLLSKDSSIIVISPYAELWRVHTQDNASIPGELTSLAIPVTLIKPLPGNWDLNLIAIPRWNGSTNNFFSKAFQMGGAAIAVYKNKYIRYKMGVYYNAEFSGAFIVPLVGIDWQINSRSNLFGVLPGALVYEYKINNHLYYGASFKAVTNSYRFVNSQVSSIDFVRIDDNLLTAYLDMYMSKRFVLNAEAGHSISRKIRLGTINDDKKYYYTNKMNDNFFFKIMLAYRVRLR